MVLTRPHYFVEASDLPPAELIFGQLPTMRIVQEKIERIAETAVPILIQGESGTGKDVLAKLLHARSNRANGAWIKVSCPAVPHSLIESELFGYEKGAFTGAFATKRGRIELAHRGTLFLDEVGSLDLFAQAKLLQVLQDGTFMRVGAQEPRRVDVRLLCAVTGSLRQQTEEGNFRPDIFYRINPITIDLPSLRHRIEDLPLLIDYFLGFWSREYRLDAKPLSREITSLMHRYNWPGNIRQLENMIRSYVLLESEEALVEEMMPIVTTGISPVIDLGNPISLKNLTKAATRDLERGIILKVLQSNGWSRQKTARWLNISYRSLLYKLQDSSLGLFPGMRTKAEHSDSAGRRQ